MTRALVTGATGFVGANVARELLARGRRVRALVRPTSDLTTVRGLDLELVEGDVCDAESVEAAVRGCDEVFHVAAEYSFWSRSSDDVFASNVGGTTNVMEAALRHGVGKVVHTSTVGTIGLGGDDAPYVPRDESSPAADGQFRGAYKQSKLEAERVALDYVDRGLPVVVVNPSTPVGPWDRKPTPTGKIIVDFMRGLMPAFVETGLNIVHVKDVAVGHVLAAERGVVGERYILGNQNLSLREILSTLARLSGRQAPWLRIPYSLAYVAGLASTLMADLVTRRPPAIPIEAVRMARYHMYFSPAKAVRTLGLPQTRTEDAFADALDWFSAHDYFGPRTGKEPRGTSWQYSSSKSRHARSNPSP